MTTKLKFAGSGYGQDPLTLYSLLNSYSDAKDRFENSKASAISFAKRNGFSEIEKELMQVTSSAFFTEIIRRYEEYISPTLPTLFPMGYKGKFSFEEYTKPLVNDMNNYVEQFKGFYWKKGFDIYDSFKKESQQRVEILEKENIFSMTNLFPEKTMHSKFAWGVRNPAAIMVQGMLFVFGYTFLSMKIPFLEQIHSDQGLDMAFRLFASTVLSLAFPIIPLSKYEVRMRENSTKVNDAYSRIDYFSNAMKTIDNVIKDEKE